MLSEPVAVSHTAPVNLPAPQSTRLNPPAILPLPAQTQAASEGKKRKELLAISKVASQDEDHRVIVLAERHASKL
jgi:hypothetical protein